VTNTPGLGAANEALNQLNYTGPQIALGYACAYPLGVVGIIGSIIDNGIHATNAEYRSGN
jgi:putative transport protein